MSTQLAPKMLKCKCGHHFESTQPKIWCEKCCRPVFYLEKDQRRHQYNTYYFVTILVMVLTFVTYIFLEMIAGPLLSM